jgi:hypothetical protein
MMLIHLWAILSTLLPLIGTEHAKPAGAMRTAKLAPVVVELFSSEGCSSCPAADQTLAEFIARAKAEKKPLYIIDFHVDYFDRLGWKDSLASPRFTERQKRYVSYFGLPSAYTPQAVINGRRESSGSDDVKLNRLINAEHKAGTRAKISCNAWRDASGKIQVEYRMAGDVNDCMLNFALYEEKVVHQIGAGENAGKTLSHNNVVRVFDQLDQPPARGTHAIGPVPSGAYQLLVFVQKKSTLEVIAAENIAPDQLRVRP